MEGGVARGYSLFLQGGKLNFLVRQTDKIATTVTLENVTGTKVGAVIAVNGAGMGNITQSGEIWKELEIADGKSSILKVEDKLYCPDDSGKLFVLSAKDGSQVGRKVSLGTINFASPVYADGKIYLQSEAGVTTVLRAGTSFEALAENKLGERTFASYAAADGAIYLRTESQLYRIQTK